MLSFRRNSPTTAEQKEYLSIYAASDSNRSHLSTFEPTIVRKSYCQPHRSKIFITRTLWFSFYPTLSNNLVLSIPRTFRENHLPGEDLSRHCLGKIKFYRARSTANHPPLLRVDRYQGNPHAHSVQLTRLRLGGIHHRGCLSTRTLPVHPRTANLQGTGDPVASGL